MERDEPLSAAPARAGRRTSGNQESKAMATPSTPVTLPELHLGDARHSILAIQMSRSNSGRAGNSKRRKKYTQHPPSSSPLGGKAQQQPPYISDQDDSEGSLTELMNKSTAQKTAGAGSSSGKRNNNGGRKKGESQVTNVNRRLFTASDLMPSSPPSGPAGPASGPCSGTHTPVSGHQGAGTGYETLEGRLETAQADLNSHIAAPEYQTVEDPLHKALTAFDVRDFAAERLAADNGMWNVYSTLRGSTAAQADTKLPRPSATEQSAPATSAEAAEHGNTDNRPETSEEIAAAA
ncbi:hypothetical protein C8A03DRAFT_38342 [Achaetomium macrosporum]|uniref:Uncharacterized protein n=1 Tax=Achaetomium macrosporum TaxID=79813 RepID=A0AAN7C253_9PEZI|nr:hypothetical protein C8A03DRAFT_38342 [Achaetomium macrosporum]